MSVIYLGDLLYTYLQIVTHLSTNSLMVTEPVVKPRPLNRRCNTLYRYTMKLAWEVQKCFFYTNYDRANILDVGLRILI